jgi:hypothetical protein
MQPRQAGVNILTASRAGEVTTTAIRLEDGEWPSPPVAPASVWADDEKTLVIELHRLTDLADNVAIFESYAVDDPVPAPGGPYALYGWWTPDQLKAAQDASLTWHQRHYDCADHDHCLLTWATINAGDAAYQSDVGWISVEAYERFIREDALRLRGA